MIPSSSSSSSSFQVFRASSSFQVFRVMDREPEELQFLGFFGIYKESYKIIYSWRKILSKITLSLILPLSFIFLAHIQVSEVLFSKIMYNEWALDHTREGSYRYYRISDHLSSEWTAFWSLEAAYLIFLLIFSLLSTSAVVYMVACIYTAKEITFKKIMSVVPKVWKRLMVTFLCNFVIMFVYNFISILILVLWATLIGGSPAGIVVLGLIIVLYLIGLVYISIVWHLASVISVLEDKYGMKAMMKSKELIKGKTFVSFAIFLKLQISFIVIKTIFEKFVVHGDSLSMGIRVGFGILSFLLLLKLMLFGLVIQTIIYFVCKSYHHENVDKSCLADHLEVYLGDYAPLKTKDVQLEQFYV